MLFGFRLVQPGEYIFKCDGPDSVPMKCIARTASRHPISERKMNEFELTYLSRRDIMVLCNIVAMRHLLQWRLL